MKLEKINLNNLEKEYKEFGVLYLTKKYNCSKSFIYSHLRKLNIPRIKKRKYKVNEDFFEIPNLTNAYIAGFIAADGYISKKYGRIVISIKKTDIDLLYYIQKITKNTCPFRYQQNSTNYGVSDIAILTIYSHKMVDDLEKIWNITENKTFTLKAPKLENELGLSFIIGYIDGDGCWGILNKKKKNIKPQLMLSIAGTKEILEWIAIQLQPFCGKLTNCRKHSRGNCYIIAYQCKQAREIKRNLLKIESGFRFNRKWQKTDYDFDEYYQNTARGPHKKYPKKKNGKKINYE